MTNETRETAKTALALHSQLCDLADLADVADTKDAFLYRSLAQHVAVYAADVVLSAYCEQDSIGTHIVERFQAETTIGGLIVRFIERFPDVTEFSAVVFETLADAEKHIAASNERFRALLRQGPFTPSPGEKLSRIITEVTK